MRLYKSVQEACGLFDARSCAVRRRPGRVVSAIGPADCVLAWGRVRRSTAVDRRRPGQQRDAHIDACGRRAPRGRDRRILAEELPGMVVLGTGGVGHPSSMAACVVHRDRVLLEYLAVSAASRGRGIGGRLVRQVARLGSPVVRDRRQRRVAVGRAARMIRCDDSRLVATIRQVAPTIRYELRRFAG